MILLFAMLITAPVGSVETDTLYFNFVEENGSIHPVGIIGLSRQVGDTWEDGCGAGNTLIPFIEYPSTHSLVYVDTVEPEWWETEDGRFKRNAAWMFGGLLLGIALSLGIEGFAK